MIEAITYRSMIDDLKNYQTDKASVGILITRPHLALGKEILSSLNFYHNMTGKRTNFYLPGYGAYWHNAYPDEINVAKIDGVHWSFSDKMFVEFIRELEKNSSWKYLGETELLLIETQNGELNFDYTLQMYLDNMLRDTVIDSVHSFFQQVFNILEMESELDKVSNRLGRKKFVEISKKMVLDNVPEYLREPFMQEKYFCVKNIARNKNRTKVII